MANRPPDRPDGGKGGTGPPATVNLYNVDEVLSALQKAVRRSLVDEALFWTLELARSGLGALAMVRFGVMCSEDVALGSPCLPQFVLAARRRFSQLAKAGNDRSASAPLLECAHVFAGGCKNREPATGAVWVSSRLEQELRRAEEGPGAHTRHWLILPAPKRVERLRSSIAASAAARDPAEQLRQEQDALLTLQSLFLDDKQELIWRLLLSLRPVGATSACPQLRPTVQALFDMVQERATSAERYAMIHALFLHTRQEMIPPHMWCTLSRPCTPSLEELSARWPGRALAIPAYALDKHTRRGGTGGRPMREHTLQGEDTRHLLLESASWWGKDVSEWSEEEIAKSHGAGIVRALHTGRGAGGISSLHRQSLLSHFYEEGVVCSDEFHLSSAGDPYREGAQAFNLALEERFGGKIPDGWVKENLKSRLQRLRASFFDSIAAGSPAMVDGAGGVACDVEDGQAGGLQARALTSTSATPEGVGIACSQPARGRRRGRLQQAYMQ